MKPDFSKEAFLDWVKKQSPKDKYIYMENTQCAYCLFLKSLGFSEASVGGTSFTIDDDTTFDLDRDLIRPLVTKPHTYGALAKRLEAE